MIELTPALYDNLPTNPLVFLPAWNRGGACPAQVTVKCGEREHVRLVIWAYEFTSFDPGPVTRLGVMLGRKVK